MNWALCGVLILLSPAFSATKNKCDTETLECYVTFSILSMAATGVFFMSDFAESTIGLRKTVLMKMIIALTFLLTIYYL
jgi:hypothetical protein